MPLRIVAEATKISPSASEGDFTLEGDSPSDFNGKESTDMVLREAVKGGMKSPGINVKGPSAYPVTEDGKQLTNVTGGVKCLYRMDYRLRSIP